MNLMTIKVAIIVLAMIICGMGIMLYQKKKYYYIGNFIYSKENKNIVINVSATGHYVINMTTVSSNPNKQAVFEIEEGSYQKKNDTLQMLPQKLTRYIYHDVKALMSNKWSKCKESVPKDYSFMLQGHKLTLNNNQFHKLSRGKVVTTKQFLKSKSKKRK